MIATASQQASPGVSPEKGTSDHRKGGLWKRMGGSAFTISLIVHGIFIILAIFFLYKWIAPPAEKIDKFVPGGGGGGNGGAEASHKIQKQMKSRMAPPSVAKRITSSSSTAAFALPESNTEMMNSVPMDIGAASAGTGSGAGGGHGSGIGTGVGSGSGPGSGPGSGRGFLSVSPFGSSGDGVTGLVGHYYDLKFDKNDKQITSRWEIPDLCKVYHRFFTSGWDEKILSKYKRAPNELIAQQFAIPTIPAEKAPTYFGAPETQFPAWCVHYKGTVIAPDSGTYRFITASDDAIAVRFDGKQVISHHYCFGPGFMDPRIQDLYSKSMLPDDYIRHPNNYPSSQGHLACGKWFNVSKGSSYSMEVLIMETGYGGVNSAVLLVQKKGEEDKPFKIFRTAKPKEDSKAEKIGNPYNIPAFDQESPLWEAKPTSLGKWGSSL